MSFNPRFENDPEFFYYVVAPFQRSSHKRGDKSRYYTERESNYSTSGSCEYFGDSNELTTVTGGWTSTSYRQTWENGEITYENDESNSAPATTKILGSAWKEITGNVPGILPGTFYRLQWEGQRIFYGYKAKPGVFARAIACNTGDAGCLSHSYSYIPPGPLYVTNFSRGSQVLCSTDPDFDPNGGGDGDDDPCDDLINPDGSCNCCGIGGRTAELFEEKLGAFL